MQQLLQLLQFLVGLLVLLPWLIGATYKALQQQIIGAEWVDLTLASGTGTFQCPFGAVAQSQLYLTITQYTATAVAESFSWSISGSVITIDSSNGTSTAVLKIKVEGWF